MSEHTNTPKGVCSCSFASHTREQCEQMFAYVRVRQECSPGCLVIRQLEFLACSLRSSLQEITFAAASAPQRPAYTWAAQPEKRWLAGSFSTFGRGSCGNIQVIGPCLGLWEARSLLRQKAGSVAIHFRYMSLNGLRAICGLAPQKH